MMRRMVLILAVIAALLGLSLVMSARTPQKAIKIYSVHILAPVKSLPSPEGVENMVLGLSNYPVSTKEFEVHATPIWVGRYMVTIKTYKKALPTVERLKDELYKPGLQGQGDREREQWEVYVWSDD